MFLARRFLSTHASPLKASLPKLLPPSTELYENTSHRWLYNEAEQLARRRVKYNVEELILAACSSVGTTACTSVSKVGEQNHTKDFRLKMDNGSSVIARIPNASMYGSGLQRVMESEVATMSATRALGVPTPKVLSWTKDASNPVGSAYLFMEDVDGVPLNKDWTNPGLEGNTEDLTKTISDSLDKLSNTPFPKFGSLYRQEDFSSWDALSFPSEDASGPISLTIGPVADALWWRPFHDEPDLPRGPFESVKDYLLAAITIERRAVERHRKDPSSLAFTASTLQDLDDVNLLLDKAELLARKLADAVPPSFLRPTLSHPGLQTQNVLLQSATNGDKTVRPFFIDWQRTSTIPLVFQTFVPPLMTYNPTAFQQNGEPLFKINPSLAFDGSDAPELPSWSLELTPEEQERLHVELRHALRHYHYIQKLIAREPYGEIFHNRIANSLPFLVQSILRACADGPAGLGLRLLSIAFEWEECAQAQAGPCPITFTQPQFTSLMEKISKQMTLARHVHVLMERVGSTDNGAVPVGRYDEAVVELELARKEWDEKTNGGPFPFEDGRWSSVLS